MNSLLKIHKTQLSKLPDVIATVVTDRTGLLLELTGDIDGETVGAVHAVCADALDQTGGTLGLGELQRAAITASRKVCIIAPFGDEVLGIYVDGARSLAAFESKLDGALRQVR